MQRGGRRERCLKKKKEKKKEKKVEKKKKLWHDVCAVNDAPLKDECKLRDSPGIERRARESNQFKHAPAFLAYSPPLRVSEAAVRTIVPCLASDLMKSRQVTRDHVCRDLAANGGHIRQSRASTLGSCVFKREVTPWLGTCIPSCCALRFALCILFANIYLV